MPNESTTTTIYVLDDGETYSLVKPVALQVTKEQLERIEGGEKVYHVVRADSSAGRATDF